MFQLWLIIVAAVALFWAFVLAGVLFGALVRLIQVICGVIGQAICLPFRLLARRASLHG